MRGVRFVQVMSDGSVVRHAVDQVGNNLTCTLRWCATHLEPVWVYRDGSYECPHALIVGWDSDGRHEIVDLPWRTGAAS